MEKMERNCDAIDLAHQIIANSVSEEEIKEQETIISGFINSTNRLSTSTRTLLDRIESITDGLVPSAPQGSGDLRIRRLNHASMVKKFRELMRRLQEIQGRASSKHQAQIERQYKISNPCGAHTLIIYL